MRNKIFIVHLFLCLFFNIKINAQSNLVPNPSFEMYDTCPNATDGQSLVLAYAWVSGGNTPDYFNTCSSVSQYAPPISGGGGWQFPRSGNAYAGLFGFFNMGVQREYAQISLLDTLIANKCYAISFYVNLRNTCIYATNNIAASFTANSFYYSGFGFYNSPSHIYKFGNPTLRDTLNWIEIKGIYTAQGNERFISIGNFKDDIDTDTLNVNPWPSGTFNGSYYLIDDISVIPIDSISGGMPAFAGNDTSVILGDSVFIGQQITNLNCSWYIGSTLIADSVSGLFVNPTVNTTYIVKQNLCGTITYDTVNVTVLPVGIEENSWSKKINIYPNPNTGNFSINFSQTGNYLIEITNSIGVCVFKDKANTNNYAVNATFSSGIYILKIYDSENNKTALKKLVIQ